MINISHFSITNNFLTDYFCVYGTLRAGMSNNRLLDGCEHIGTYTVTGLRYNGGLSASYTGNPQDNLVVDVFKVTEENRLEKNIRVDGLEGIYIDNPEKDYHDVSTAEHEDMSGLGSYYNYGKLVLNLPATDVDPGSEEATLSVVTKFYHMPDDVRENLRTNDYCYSRMIRAFNSKINPSPAEGVFRRFGDVNLDQHQENFPKSYAFYQTIYNSLND